MIENSADTGTKKTSEGVWFSSLKNGLKYLVLIFRYSLLLVMLLFLAGHERANPKVGKTTIEFFNTDFRLGILMDIKNAEVTSYDENLEKKLIYWFYSGRKFQPAWTLNYETNNSFDDLIALLNSAENYGLFSSLYITEYLGIYNNLMHTSSDDSERLNARVKLERATSLAAFRFMINLASGIGDYDTAGVYMSFINNLPSYLNHQIEEKRIREGVLELQPKSKEYGRLQKALERYLTRTVNDTLHYELSLLEGNINLIMSKLVTQGYLERDFIVDSNDLSNAIRTFQKYNSLEESGTIDKQTLEALSISTKNKFYQISLNLDRLRRDELINKNSILVNIPEFHLYYYDNEGKNTQFNIIVGKKHTPTPELTSRINRIVANPHWTVPKSITYNEIIPRLRTDSTYLQRNGFSIIDNQENLVNASSIDWKSINPGEFDYWIRQNNSEDNALGVVKFLFPNPHRVYLHDTQSKKLFNRNIRAFSHGCVRVQNPQELAQMIISADRNSETDFDIYKMINTNKSHHILLDEPILIFIRYYTCTADDEGNIYFHPDIYSRDGKELEELLKVTRG